MTVCLSVSDQFLNLTLGQMNIGSWMDIRSWMDIGFLDAIASLELGNVGQYVIIF